MPALVVGDDLTSADKRAVRFPVLEMLSPDDTRVDNVGYSYKAFESNLQRQTVASSNLGFGIPQIFRVDASYSDTSAIATHEKTVTIYSQASQLIPKAKVVIDEKQISLDPDFVSQVEKILSPGTGAPKEDITVRLLALLRKYGHFVPLSMMLGGRIILHATTKLSDSSQFEMVKREFKVAADAKLSVEGVPVEGGGGVGVGTEHTNTASATQQFKSLLMVLRGGNESLGDSRESGQLGTKWIASLAPYLEWKTVGFYDNSLVPIIAFLPEKTRDLCERLLRDYFRSQLDSTESDSAGKKTGEKFGQNISHVKGIKQIAVNHGGCVDGLQVTFEVYNRTRLGPTQTDTTKWIGKKTGNNNDYINLKDDEEIAAIETSINSKLDIVQQVAFVTNRGRYPAHDFYGRDKGDQLKRIEAPRVRGIFGSTGALVHHIGLSYLALATGAHSREYLLAMEPFLFPDRNYAPTFREL